MYKLSDYDEKISNSVIYSSEYWKYHDLHEQTLNRISYLKNLVDEYGRCD